MPEKHTLPARLRAGAAAVLLALLLLIRPAAAAMPGAHAQLADLSCRFSHGAQAAAAGLAILLLIGLRKERRTA